MGFHRSMAPYRAGGKRSVNVTVLHGREVVEWLAFPEIVSWGSGEQGPQHLRLLHT